MEYNEYDKIRQARYTATGEVYSATGSYTTDDEESLQSIGGSVFSGADCLATFHANIADGEPKITIEDCEARYLPAVLEFVTEVVEHYKQ